jgi:hypothetical protein
MMPFTAISLASFNARRSIVYYSQFKPSEPYGIADGVFVVPSGWQVPAHKVAGIR